MPAKGEQLRIGRIEDLTGDALTRAALKRLAAVKAPGSVSQLVMWHVADGFDWPTVDALSRGWANGHERALARQFVERLRDGAPSESESPDAGVLHFELTSRRPAGEALEAEFRKAIEGKTMLGLTVRSGMPAGPMGPAIGIRIRLDELSALAQVSTSDEAGVAWVPAGKFHVDLGKDGKLRKAEDVADEVAKSLLAQLTGVRLLNGKKVDGKPTYKLQIENISPLVLNGLMLTGSNAAADAKPTGLAGFCVPPHRSLTLPAGAEMVDRLGLKGRGARLLAADFSGL